MAEPPSPLGRAVLRTDASVSCLSQEYGYFLGYSVVMVFLYLVGVPGLYWAILNRSKSELNPRSIEVGGKTSTSNSNPSANLSISTLLTKDGRNEGMIVEMRKRNGSIRIHRFLWLPYRPKFYWYENFELLRKLFQASIVSCCIFLEGGRRRFFLKKLISSSCGIKN